MFCLLFTVCLFIKKGVLIKYMDCCMNQKHEILYMGVSKSGGTPKSSILIGFSILNHPFWGTPIFGNTHIAIRLKIQFEERNC